MTQRAHDIAELEVTGELSNNNLISQENEKKIEILRTRLLDAKSHEVVPVSETGG